MKKDFNISYETLKPLFDAGYSDREMAYEKELRSFKIGIKLYNDRKELIQEITNMINGKGINSANS